MMVLRKMMDIANSPRERAIAWLLIGAIFFAMRSCEYCKTSGEENKRTRIVRLKNITFKKQNKILAHSDENLAQADIVQIEFEYQKNDRRNVKVHMFRSGDSLLCPVIAWATTVKRVLKVQGASDLSEVCLFEDERGRTSLLQATHIRSRLRAVVAVIGSESLGFDKDDIGLHSLRSGGAMAMFLSGISVIVIQRVGRWSSEAFLEYIREQLESFTLDVSKKMLCFEEFLNLSDNNNASNFTNVSDAEMDDEQNDDGPETIPFGIRFNTLSLHEDERIG